MPWFWLRHERCVLEIVNSLDTEIEKQEAEVFWSVHQAIVVVPGEKHVRKQ